MQNIEILQYEAAIRALEQEREMRSVLLDSNPHFSLMLNEYAELIDCNAATLAMLGYTDKEKLKSEFHKVLLETIPPMQSNGTKTIPFSTRLETVLREGLIKYETELIINDKLVHYDISMQKIPYHDNIVIMLYLVDNTEHYDSQRKVEYRERLLKTVNETAALLISNESDLPMEALRMSMETIGSYVGVDRINIWKQVESEGKIKFYRDMGWESEEITRTIPLEKNMSSFPYMVINDDWYTMLKMGKVVNQMVSDLPEGVYGQLEEVGIQSILIVPVHIEGEYWGYVSFDNCHSENQFAAEVIEILRTSSLIIASALMRNEMLSQLIEAREEAMLGTKAKSDFLASMSHEIRTPLNAVIGMTSIGKNAATAERKDYCFGKIEDASKHLLGVINDILDMSKIEANKLELSEVLFEFEKLLQHVVSVSLFRIEEKKQNLMVYLDEAIPEFVIGDDQRLAQVITNLLSNAVKFTPEHGSINLNTSFVSQEDDIYTIQIEVKDNGIGISDEQMSKLFTNFQQAAADTARKYGGTGLGLAISKRIVEMMDGDIRVESEVGKGTSFIFTIKLREAKEKEKKKKLGDGITAKNLRILFVDDDKEIREYFDDISKRLGIKCEIAEDGEKVLALMDEGKDYDIFFVDWKMPGIDGVELTKKIREKLGARSIITMISAYELAGIEDVARDAGVDRFMTKPLFPSAIANMIAESLSQIQASNELEQEIETDNFEGARILLAEDVEINREILTTILEPMSVLIDCAEDGAEALDMFMKDPFGYDIILMDVQMPVMDGYEATRKIRALPFARAREIPIIALTANVFTEDIEKCLEVGMNKHLGKPLNIDDILSVLREYLKP